MSKPLRVLIVEDSEDDALLIARQLRNSGFDLSFKRVDNSASLRQALDTESWDVVIADFAMPSFSGLAALELLQETGLDLPFLLVSGTIGEDLAVAAMKAGAHDYVLKDNLARLGPAVRRELHEAEVRRARKQAEEALRQRTAQLEALQQVGIEITAHLDLDTLLHSIVSRAIELLRGSSGGLYLYQPDRDVLEWSIGIGPHLPPIGSILQRGEGVSGKVWETGEPVVVNDYKAWEGRSPAFEELANVASVGVLVHWGDDALGVLNVLADVDNTFTSVDAEILSLFATQAAIAIRNAQLFKEAHSQAERLEVVNHIARAVGTTLQLDPLLETVYRQIDSIFQADAFFIALYDEEADELVFRLQVDEGQRQPLDRQPLGTGLTSVVVAQKAPLLVQDMEKERDNLPAPYLWGTMKHSASWLGVPMQTADQLVGVICVQAYQPNAYGKKDQLLLSTIADQVATAVERARLYQILRHSEQRYRALFEQANDAVFVETLEGQILDVNDRACQLLGYSREELLDMTVADLVPAEVQELLPELIEQEISQGGMRIEAENLRKDGSRVPVEVSTALLQVGGTNLILALVRDITERRRAEQLLEALNKASTAMTSALTPQEIFGAVAMAFREIGLDSVVFLIDESGTRLLPRYLSYGGRLLETAEKLVGLDTARFAIPIEAVDPYRRIVQDRQSVFWDNPEEVARQALPGPLKRLARTMVKLFGTINSVGAPLIVEDEVIGIFTVQAPDLTADDVPAITAFAHQMSAAWRKAQLMVDLEASLEELKRTQLQFLQAQKMEAIGRLAGGVAHDFNNLLTVIQFSTQLMERSLVPEDPLWTYVQQIKEATQRATRLTKQLLVFSRRELIEPQSIDLGQVVGDLSQMLRRIIGENIKLSTHLQDDLWAIHADPAQIEQVIINLVVNARDAMPSGGKLLIETANVVLDQAYAAYHMDVRPGEYVLLTVSDTGIGMDDEIKTHLFEPFFTTKERGKGTGLGLATVFGIVKQNEGHIWVYSEVDRGTTFKIYLPRSKKVGTEQPDKPRLKPSGEVRGTETILIVEDEKAVRNLAAEILSAHGYQVLITENGAEALRIAEGYRAPIHLLLTDVVLPDMNGQQLAEGLKIHFPRLQVLFMSGYSDNVIAHHGVLEEGIAFLPKPFSVEALTHKVRAVLEADR